MAKSKVKADAKEGGKEQTYGMADNPAARKIDAPDLPYRPRDPKTYKPNLGLIACGGITQSHLRAYKKAGYRVAALCDVNPERAIARQREFYPEAAVTTDYREVLRRDDIEVVDLATHPADRLPLIEQAIRAGKHVLSQKPFVLDLDRGHRLADLADQHGVKLAVNQNGRWAPHFSYLRQVVNAGLIGNVLGAHLSVHWDHNWVAGTPFDQVRHLVLYDFAIHWFDIVHCFMGGRRATKVYASNAVAEGQRAKPPLLGQAVIEYEGAQASLAFDASLAVGAEDRTFLGGTAGVATSIGSDLGHQRVTVRTAGGWFSPKLKGAWFPDGFHGTMAELLCAIEERREPTHGARDNLNGLAVCFAACKAADSGKPQVPGKVRKL